MDTTVVQELVALVREQSEQQAGLVREMVELQKAQTQMFQAWFQMFSTNTAPTESTSMEEREERRAREQSSDWVPLDPAMMQAILNIEES